MHFASFLVYSSVLNTMNNNANDEDITLPLCYNDIAEALFYMLCPQYVLRGCLCEPHSIQIQFFSFLSHVVS